MPARYPAVYDGLTRSASPGVSELCTVPDRCGKLVGAGKSGLPGNLLYPAVTALDHAVRLRMSRLDLVEPARRIGKVVNRVAVFPLQGCGLYQCHAWPPADLLTGWSSELPNGSPVLPARSGEV